VHLLQAQEDIGIERRREGFLGFTVRARVCKGNENLCFIIENSISNFLPLLLCSPLRFVAVCTLTKGVVEFTRQVA
jgi:hypothetical protein